MSIIKNYIAYLKDNPEGYWFKRKLYGWGWTPARWQGWVVIVVAIAIFLKAIQFAQYDDAPGVALLGLIAMVGIVFGFGYWKGEKPRWQWGAPKKD